MALYFTSSENSDSKKYLATKIRLHLLIFLSTIGSTIDHCLIKSTSSLLEYGFSEHSY